MARAMRDEVHIVHAQWYDKVAYHKVAHPETGELVEMSSDQIPGRQYAIPADGRGGPQERTALKRVYKQAFLGAKSSAASEITPGRRVSPGSASPANRIVTRAIGSASLT